MRIKIDGDLQKGVTSKDIIMFIISKLSSGGATGYFVEYSGSTIGKLSMEARMTICNMTIEMGARGGLIAADEITFNYLKQTKYFKDNPAAEKEISSMRELKSDQGAVFDKEVSISAGSIKPMVTYGTNPGMAIAVDEYIPSIENQDGKESVSFLKSLDYMGFKPGEKIAGHPVDYVFLGSCTNGRREDFRAFVALVKGKKKAPNITALLVPGSKRVEEQVIKEGLLKIINDAGFELRQPGCSSCLAMNEDKIPPGKYAVSTSNRNFEGRQGPGARTLLASPLTAAAAAVTGRITDPRELL
jgi:3-isopropylmalate/(R)-2-methylmalate dehydratase large subunit